MLRYGKNGQYLRENNLPALKWRLWVVLTFQNQYWRLKGVDFLIHFLYDFQILRNFFLKKLHGVGYYEALLNQILHHTWVWDGHKSSMYICDLSFSAVVIKMTVWEYDCM
jgi:hypothetical protein